MKLKVPEIIMFSKTREILLENRTLNGIFCLTFQQGSDHIISIQKKCYIFGSASCHFRFA